MEGSQDKAAVGNNSPTSTHERHTSAEISADQITLPPAVPGVEGSVLADTLNQLLQVPMNLDPSMGFLEDPTGLIQSTLGADDNLLASLNPGATFSANPSTTEPVKPAGKLEEEASSRINCSIEQPLCVPPHTSTSELAELNIRQLASSIIDSASVGTSISPSTPGTSNSGLLGVGTVPGMAENLMDQISPPMELPDLNLAMAEGMAVSCEADEKEEMITEYVGLSAQNEGTDHSVVSSTQQPISNVSAPVGMASSRTAEMLTVDAATATGLVSQYTSPSLDPGSACTLATQSSSTTASASVSSFPSSAAVSSTVAAQTNPVTIHQQPSTSLVTVLPPSTLTTAPITLSSVPAALKVAPAATFPTQSTSTALFQSSVSSAASTVSFPPPFAVTHSTTTATAVPSLSTSQSVNAAASMLAKGLNLPLLQFLHLNFPSLKIKDLQDVLNINTLLAQVLKQQINAESRAATQQQTAVKTTNLGIIGRTSGTATTTPVQLATPSVSKTLSTPFVQPKSTLPSSISALSALPATAPRSATQTGLFVPSAPLGALSTLTKQQPAAMSSLTPGILTSSSSLTTTFSEVKAMPARPVRADSQPVILQPQTGAINVDLLSKQSSSLLSSLSSPANSPPSSSSASSRKAVLVQILNKTSTQQSSTSSLVTSSSLSSSPLTTSTTPTRTPIMIPRTTSLSKSPLILNRHGRMQQNQTPFPLAGTDSDPSTPTSSSTKSTMPLSSLCVSLSLPALRKSLDGRRKRKTPSRKSAHFSSHHLDLSQQLSHTVVQPAESEAMEVDVGQPIQKLELPKHLKDHSYSTYNPEEGEKQLESPDGSSPSVSSIPPARLSYAPQVPDSPSTLHKLLKVLPKKSARQSLASTPPPRFSSNQTPSGRASKGRGGRKSASRGGKARGKGVAKKTGSTPVSQAGSEDESRASSSDQSDVEDMSSKVCAIVSNAPSAIYCAVAQQRG